MNIILIGHQSCGKTSVGKVLAIKLEKKFIDTDEYIAAKQQQAVREIYEQRGEIYFRKLEEQAIASLVGLENTIVATGGGAVLQKKNVEILKKIGALIYLDLSFDQWKKRIEQQTLPAVLRDEKNIFEHYQTRKSIYQKIADFTIQGNQRTIEEVIEVIVTSSKLLNP